MTVTNTITPAPSTVHLSVDITIDPADSRPDVDYRGIYEAGNQALIGAVAAIVAVSCHDGATAEFAPVVPIASALTCTATFAADPPPAP